MTAFTVWKFEVPDGAEQAVGVLKDAESDGLVKIVDHAVLTWPVGAEEPKLDHAHENTKRGAGWGALGGVLVGALFTIPVVGGVAGAALGAWSRKSQDTDISQEDLERVRAEVVEGTSALFIVTEAADFDRLGERFRVGPRTLISTNLTESERDLLLETFGGK